MADNKSTSTATEDRALALLGSGVPAEQVASALGVSASRISQLLSREEFAAQVQELRFNNLQQHNERDSKYDELEDKLIAKLDKSLAFIMKPESILKAIQVVNNAKRRGQSSPEQVSASQTVVQVVLPATITQNFTTNTNNQVVAVGDDSLLTIQSGVLKDKLEARQEERQKALTHQESSSEEEKNISPEFDL